MDKEYVKLRIAEEAMLRGINIKWTTSTHSHVVVTGDKFKVTANLNETHGWVIKEASTRSGDDGVGELEYAVSVTILMMTTRTKMMSVRKMLMMIRKGPCAHPLLLIGLFH